MTSASSLAFLAFNGGMLRLLAIDCRAYPGIISCLSTNRSCNPLAFLPHQRFDYLARCSMKPLRILLVDDESNARTRLRRLLQNEERVEIIGEASDGLEAVAEIERLRPDLIFLDVQMPGLDGFEVLRALPAGLPKPLIIFVTGFHEHAMAAFDANAIAYLLKPIETERLREMLERAWRIRHFGEDPSQSATPPNQVTTGCQPRLK
jgi:CheY-like chemotaxis protein